MFHNFSIFSVCVFKNKFYIETKLNRDLKDDLMKLFSDHVAKKHVSTLICKCYCFVNYDFRSIIVINYNH